MNEKQKNDAKKVMLVQDAKDGNVKAITGLDKGSMLNVDTNDSFMKPFLKR